MNLSVADFPAFFRAVYGVDPFPWQDRLARHVAANGWPEALDIPTGCGKTAAIDIAVFTLALQAEHPIVRRLAPVRIVFIVDRRLVVDDAYGRALRLQLELGTAAGGDGALAAVSSRGCAVSPRTTSHHWQWRACEAAFHTSRTGRARRASRRCWSPPSTRWAPASFSAAMACRTRCDPIHAGLLGRDALILLDEAHLVTTLPADLTRSCVAPLEGRAGQPAIPRCVDDRDTGKRGRFPAGRR